MKSYLFLAHLSRRLRMSFCDHSLSVVSCSLHPSTPLNNFLSEIFGPVFFNLHVGPCVKMGLKIYTSGHGLLSKVATMPIYSKNT